MKVLAALLLLATLVSCAGPERNAVDQTAVVEAGAACRVSHSGAPVLADRGIGGTGAPSKIQVADRGIGGTGIVGVVTGFASVCVDGLEVRLDKTVPIAVNGAAATMGQLRVGQLVVINASKPSTGPVSDAQARTIAVRYEVSGPIEAIDLRAGAITVAGQLVIVKPATWIDGRFGIGNWTTVSGLRQSDGAIVASRLDRAPVGAMAVRGQIVREGGITRIGSLVLHGPAVTNTAPGTFVSVVGKYADKTAEVTSIDTDLLAQDPVGYFGTSAQQLIVQAFVHASNGLVWLNNGRSFTATPEVTGSGRGYHNAIVWLKRTADGSFTATDLHYTNYRAQPKDVPAKAPEHGPGDVPPPPPYLPPMPPGELPPLDAPQTDAPLTSMNPDTNAPLPADDTNGIVAPPSSGNTPTSNVNPSRVEPAAGGMLVVGRHPVIPALTLAANE
jgi:hypothetical protein